MLFAVSVSWSIVRHCPSPSSQGANTLRGDNLLVLLCSLSAGSLVEEREDVYLTKGHFEAPCLPGKVRFHPSWTILDDVISIVRVQQGSQPVSSIETHPSWSCTSISVEGQVAWSFFFVRLTLWETTSIAWIIQVLWIIIWLFRKRVLDGCWLLLKRRVEKGSEALSFSRNSL